MESQNVLTAVGLLERVIPMLKQDKRDQLNRTNLESIQRVLGIILDKLTPFSENFKEILVYIGSTQNLIEEILSDLNFDMTDTETKELIVKNIVSAMDEIYLEAGKFYYTENSFSYDMGLDGLLQRIIDKCIDKGFYFGQVG